MTHSAEIERVAEAIFEECCACRSPILSTWEDCKTTGAGSIYFRAARAAMKAIREPSEGMRFAAHKASREGSPYFAPMWRAAIDEVLK